MNESIRKPINIMCVFVHVTTIMKPLSISRMLKTILQGNRCAAGAAQVLCGYPFRC